MNAVFDQAQIQINRDRTCRPCSDHTSLRAACSPTCKAPQRQMPGPGARLGPPARMRAAHSSQRSDPAELSPYDAVI